VEGHLAHPYGGFEAINRGEWRGSNTFGANTLSLHKLSLSLSFPAAARRSNSNSNNKGNNNK